MTDRGWKEGGGFEKDIERPLWSKEREGDGRRKERETDWGKERKEE